LELQQNAEIFVDKGSATVFFGGSGNKPILDSISFYFSLFLRAIFYLFPWLAVLIFVIFRFFWLNGVVLGVLLVSIAINRMK